MLDNATIAELLIREAAAAEGHREKSFRRAAHAAFMWPEEAGDIAAAGRSLTELDGIGPSLAGKLHRWIQEPPTVETPPIRQEFLTLANARRVLAKQVKGKAQLKGDLQMHTLWSDGSGTVSQMAAAGVERGYLRNPDIQILGHPQTRMYDRRTGLRADWHRAFAEAARLDKAVEIDGYADRQDLRLSLLKIARKEGVRISLGTDAHHPEQLAFMELALAAAYLAKIPFERIVSFLPLPDLKAWVSNVRGD